MPINFGNPMEIFRIRNIMQNMDPTWGDTPAPALPLLAEQQSIAQAPMQEPMMGPEPAIANMPTYTGSPVHNPEIANLEEQPLPPELDYQKEMLELYKPEHEASDRLDAIISRIPQRNKPGIIRKIAASFIGLGGGMPAADQALYAPYYNQLKDWKTEYEPVKDLAQEERLSNSNMRMLANNILSQRMSDRRLQRMYARDEVLRNQGERRLGQGDTRLEQGNQRIELAREGLNLRKELAEGGQIVKDDRGNTFLLNKRGEFVPVPLENLSFEDKEAIKANERIRVAKNKPVGSSGQRPRLQLKTNADGSYEVINLDEAYGKTVKSQETGKEVKPPTTELDKNRALTRKAMEIKNSNPDWNKYITFDKAGRFSGIKPPHILGTPFGSSPSKEVYDQIYQRIYGTAAPTENTVNPKNAPPPIEQRKVGMEFTFPNGNVGKWDGSKWVPVKIVKR